jgi:hypothetical protein
MFSQGTGGDSSRGKTNNGGGQLQGGASQRQERVRAGGKGHSDGGFVQDWLQCYQCGWWHRKPPGTLGPKWCECGYKLHQQQGQQQRASSWHPRVSNRAKGKGSSSNSGQSQSSKKSRARWGRSKQAGNDGDQPKGECVPELLAALKDCIDKGSIAVPAGFDLGNFVVAPPPAEIPEEEKPMVDRIQKAKNKYNSQWTRWRRATGKLADLSQQRDILQQQMDELSSKIADAEQQVADADTAQAEAGRALSQLQQLASGKQHEGAARSQHDDQAPPPTSQWASAVWEAFRGEVETQVAASKFTGNLPSPTDLVSKLGTVLQKSLAEQHELAQQKAARARANNAQGEQQLWEHPENDDGGSENSVELQPAGGGSVQKEQGEANKRSAEAAEATAAAASTVKQPRTSTSRPSAGG